MVTLCDQLEREALITLCVQLGREALVTLCMQLEREAMVTLCVQLEREAVVTLCDQLEEENKEHSCCANFLPLCSQNPSPSTMMLLSVVSALLLSYQQDSAWLVGNEP